MGSSNARPIGKLERELRRIVAQVRKTVLSGHLRQRWGYGQDGEGTGRRVYPDYETYLQHQRLKLEAHREKSIRGHDRRFHQALFDRLSHLDTTLRGSNVLCLAARQGSEVRAFIDRGAFALGIDLNPGRDNRYVVVGDFHDLQFATDSVDVVYTNSLDHVYDVVKVLEELTRVLRPGGLVIVEVGLGADAGHEPGFYESFSWKGIDELLNVFLDQGLQLENRLSFDIPWPGEHLVMRAAS